MPLTVISPYVARSRDVILAHQAHSGAYLASPSFADYRYCWLRDGTFIAYAMDLIGEHASAGRFYAWCGQTIMKHKEKIRTAIRLAAEGKEVPLNLLLHARYTVEGEEVKGEWGTYQLDGYGAWLWGVAEHLRLLRQPEKFALFRAAVDLTVEYLLRFWNVPNFDCWEENSDRIHPSTLAAIYGGLNAVLSCYADEAGDGEKRGRILSTLKEIKRFLLTAALVCERQEQAKGSPPCYFRKMTGCDAVDGSLLWLSVPFRVFAPDDPRIVCTVAKIERDLAFGGGVHRYLRDTYYGGGLWVILSAWLGWYDLVRGDRASAEQRLTWIEGQFDEEGHLPEQAADHLLFPSAYDAWIKKRGRPAKPLLWSHAMYLILRKQWEKGE
ncbi:hypothetical protein BSNK01_29110 [Bacillaceae bacterium]